MQRLFQAVVFIWLFIAFYTHLEVGIADNSDFTRVMTHFTSGPVNVEQNWPNPQRDPDAWQSRFFNYWIPYWHLDFPAMEPSLNSSVVWLWYPGVALNYLVYSKTVLSMQFIALFPRLLIVGAFWMLLRWLWRESDRPILHALFFVLPLVAVVSSADYTIFFNSFYFETASFVYGLLLLVALLYLHSTRNWGWFFLSLGLVTLLILAKASHIYWLLTIPLLLWLVGLRRWRLTWLTICLCVPIFLQAQSFNRHPALTRFNQHNSLFYGVLMLSERPNDHLATLGMPNAELCVGKMVFTFMGRQCDNVYGDQMGFRNTVRVIITEPSLLLKIPKQIADNMHETGLGYLGRRAEADPFAYQWRDTHRDTLNLWLNVRKQLPTGWGFFCCIAIYALLFFRWRHKPLAAIGLLLTGLIPLDMGIAFLGDGNQELMKHLLFANWMFDIATVMLLGTLSAELIPAVIRYWKLISLPFPQWKTKLSLSLARRLASAVLSPSISSNTVQPLSPPPDAQSVLNNSPQR